MVVAMSACSSCGAEKIVEEILPTTMAGVIHLSSDAPELDIDFELIEVEQTIFGLSHSEDSAYTKISSGIDRETIKDTNVQKVATVDNFVLVIDIDNTVYTENLLANMNQRYLLISSNGV